MSLLTQTGPRRFSSTSFPGRALIAGLVYFLALGGPADAVDFDRDVRPILSANCFQCHGPDEQARQAELRLDTRDGLLDEDREPRVVVPGDPLASELVRRITSDDEYERMPPPESNLSLTAAEIETLRMWVAAGADWQGHWSFEPLSQPDVPQVSDATWPNNAIDHFVLARLEKEGLTPSPEAEKSRLLRRVTLDLTGLPPTPAETRAFLADEDPYAYERVVDRLLASPRYGERMAWEWLDAARYADTNGFQGDPVRTMWPWRDWVIGAINANMPFDQFTIEQLAGDLLPDATLQQRIASGFNRNHMYNGEGGRIPEETRVENVFDRVETTSTVWMGLTMTCARCHDHKFDPITQAEYYRLFDFFNQTSEEGKPVRGNIPPFVHYYTPTAQQRLDAAIAELSAASTEVAQMERLRFALGGGETQADPDGLPEEIRDILAKQPQERDAESIKKLIEYVKQSAAQYQQALERLEQARASHEKAKDAAVEVMVMDTLSEPRPTAILDRGSYNKPGETVTAGVPGALPELPTDAAVDRLALARWLVDPAHPLTARVVVNRHWQTFFGVGLVATSEDFGSQGERPSHPELLDWLADEFIYTGWDVKRLHRLIVTSATYRQTSRAMPELRERDPDNRLLARAARYRMPAWMLRDQALAAAGLLVERIGGPPVKPYQPAGLWTEATFGKIKYEQDSGEELYRRSLYTFWRRIVGPPVFFDSAKRQTCEVNASRTNTPLHALTTLNDITFVEAARAMAERLLLSESQTAEERIALAFQIALARDPDAEEREVLLNRHSALQQSFEHNPDSAAKLLDVGESAADAKLDRAEHAAYTAICLLIMNLDEALTRE